jgi:hypothetical protein
MKRTLLAVCSDLHGGHRYGLLNPDTILEETDETGEIIGTYHPPLNKTQRYLWQTYTEQIKTIGDMMEKGDELIVIMNGDMTAGNKYPHLLVSDRIADQFIIGEYNIRPWYALKPTAVRLIKGTGAHVFGHGSAEVLIAHALSLAFPKISTVCTDHSLITTAGVDIDISHHGPVPGSRQWLKGNEARYYLRSAMLEEIVAGKTPPKVYLRGHYHEDIEESLIVKANGHRYKSSLIITPSFCFIDDHARQATKSPARITHGMMLIELVDGEVLRTIPLTKTLDIRTKETI